MSIIIGDLLVRMGLDASGLQGMGPTVDTAVSSLNLLEKQLEALDGGSGVLKSLDATPELRNMVTSLNQVNQSLIEQKTAASEAKSEFRLLQYEMTALKPPVQGATESIEAFDQRIAEWRSQTDALRPSLIAAQTTLDGFRAGITEAQRAVNSQVAEIRNYINAQKEANSQTMVASEYAKVMTGEILQGNDAIEEHTWLTNDVVRGLAHLVGAFSAVGAGVMIFRDIISTVKAAYLETEDASVSLISRTGAVGTQLDALDISMFNVANDGSVAAISITEIGKTMGELAATLHLVSGRELEEVTADVINFAFVTGQSSEKVAEDVSKLAKAWGLYASDIADALQKIRDASILTGTKEETLQQQLLQFGPVTRELGLSLDQATFLFGKLNDAGANVPQTMQFIQQAIRTLSKDNLKDPIEGINAIIQKLAGGTEGDSIAAAAALGGRNVYAFVDAVRTGKIVFDDFTHGATGTTAAINDQAKAMETARTAYQRFKNEAESGGIFDFLMLGDLKRDLQSQVPSSQPGARPTLKGFSAADAITLANADSLLPDGVTIKTTPVSANAKKAIDDATGGTGKTGKTGLPTDPEYQLLQRQVKLLQEQNAGKNNKAALYQELGDLLDLQANHPEIVDLAKQLTVVQQSIKDKQQYGLPVDDTVYQKETDLHYQKQLAALDTRSAEKILGLPDPALIDSTIALETHAFDLLRDKAGESAEFISIAWAKAADNILKQMRSVGEAVSAADVITVDWADTMELVETMDFGKARNRLGVGTEELSSQHDLTAEAAFNSILEARSQGFATDNDVLRANIALLLDEQKNAAQAGKAFEDVKQALLDVEQAQKQIQSMNTEGAFKALGLPSPADVANLQTVLDAAYAKIQAAALAGKATDSEVTQARIDELSKLVSASRNAGILVKEGWIIEMEDLKAKNALVLLDIGTALGQLGILTTKAAGEAITQLEASLALVAQKYGTDSAEFMTAQASAYKKEIDDLQKSGQAVSDDLVQRFDKAQAQLKNATMTIDQAYNALGTRTAAQSEATLSNLSTALQRMQDSGSATAQQMELAQANYLKAYYDDAIARGDDYDKRAKAWNDAHLASLRITLAGEKNAWTELGHVIGDIYNQMASGFSSTITGMLFQGKDLVDGLKTMGEQLVGTAITSALKNFVFTPQNLQNMLGGIFKLFGAEAPALVSGAGTTASATALTTASTTAAATITTAAAGFAAEVDTAGIGFGTEVDIAGINFGTEVDIAGGTFSGEVDGAGAGFATEVDTAGAALVAQIDGAGGAFVGEVDGSGAGFVGEVDGAGIGFAAEVDGAGIGFGTEVDIAGGAFGVAVDAAGAAFATAVGTGAASQGLSQGANGLGGLGSLASGAAESTAEGAGGFMDALGGLTGIVGIAQLGVSIVSGIVSGVQQAHANALLDKIEKSTRFTWIATGEASDSISRTSKTTSQTTQALVDYMNTTNNAWMAIISQDLDKLVGQDNLTLNANIDLSPVTNILGDIDGQLQSITVNTAAIVDELSSMGGGGNQTSGSGHTSVESMANIRSMAQRLSDSSNAHTDLAAATNANVTATNSNVTAMANLNSTLSHSYPALASVPGSPISTPETGENAGTSEGSPTAASAIDPVTGKYYKYGTQSYGGGFSVGQITGDEWTPFDAKNNEGGTQAFLNALLGTKDTGGQDAAGGIDWLLGQVDASMIGVEGALTAQSLAASKNPDGSPTGITSDAFSRVVEPVAAQILNKILGGADPTKMNSDQLQKVVTDFKTQMATWLYNWLYTSADFQRGLSGGMYNPNYTPPTRYTDPNLKPYTGGIGSAAPALAPAPAAAVTGTGAGGGPASNGSGYTVTPDAGSGTYAAWLKAQGILPDMSKSYSGGIGHSAVLRYDDPTALAIARAAMSAVTATPTTLSSGSGFENLLNGANFANAQVRPNTNVTLQITGNTFATDDGPGELASLVVDELRRARLLN